MTLRNKKETSKQFNKKHKKRLFIYNNTILLNLIFLSVMNNI